MIYLDDYPIHSSNEACSRYMHSINWNGISEKVSTGGVFYFDVSDALQLFPHLELDENYVLICYISREYHGLWGRVAAIQKDAPKTPVHIQVNPHGGFTFELPEVAVPPMEAVYNNGSPAGFFESLLAAEFFSALPYTSFEQERWENCIFCPPTCYQTDWDHYVDLSDWRPRLFREQHSVTIYACWRHVENELGASNGKDLIYLTQHTIYSSPDIGYYFASKNTSSMYKSHLWNNPRYGPSRHCCVSLSQQILIARQKFSAHFSPFP